eukprot:g17473.t1
MHRLEDFNFCTLDPRLPADGCQDEPVHRVDWSTRWVDAGVAVPIYRRDGVTNYGFTLPEEVWDAVRVILSGAVPTSEEAKERVRKAVEGCHFVLQTTAKFADEEIVQRAPAAVYDCIRARMDQSLIGACGMHIKSDDADAVVLWLSHSIFAEIPPSMDSFTHVLPPQQGCQRGINGSYVGTPCMDNTIPLFPAAEQDILPSEEYVRACKYSCKVLETHRSGRPVPMRFQSPLLSHDTTLEDRKIYKTKGAPVFNPECPSASTPYGAYTTAEWLKKSKAQRREKEDFFGRKISGDEWRQLQKPENTSLREQWINGEMKCQKGIDKAKLYGQYAESDFLHEPRVPTDRPCRELLDPAGATYGQLAVGYEDELQPIFVEVSLLQLMLSHIAEVRRWTRTLHPSTSFAAVLSDPSAEKNSEWGEMGKCWMSRATHIRWGSSFAEPTVLAKYKQHIQLLPTWSGDDVTVLILAIIAALTEVAPGDDDYGTTRARVDVCVAAAREIWHRVEVSYPAGMKITAGEVSRMNLALYRKAEGVLQGLAHVDHLHLAACLRGIISGHADTYFSFSSRYGDIWQSLEPGFSFWGNVLPVLDQFSEGPVAVAESENSPCTFITQAVADAVEVVRIFRDIWPTGILPSHSLLLGDCNSGRGLHGEHAVDTEGMGKAAENQLARDQAAPWRDSEWFHTMRKNDGYRNMGLSEAVVAVATGRIAETELPGVLDKEAFAILLAMVLRGAIFHAPILFTANNQVNVQSKVDCFGHLVGAESSKEITRHIFDCTALRYVRAGPHGDKLKDAIGAAKGGSATTEQTELVTIEQRRRCGSAGRDLAAAGVKAFLEHDSTIGGDNSGTEFLRQCRRELAVWEYCLPLVVDEMVRTVEWLTADRSYRRAYVDDKSGAFVSRLVKTNWRTTEDGRLKSLRRDMELPSETLRWRWLAMVELMKMPGGGKVLGGTRDMMRMCATVCCCILYRDLRRMARATGRRLLVGCDAAVGLIHLLMPGIGRPVTGDPAGDTASLTGKCWSWATWNDLHSVGASELVTLATPSSRQRIETIMRRMLVEGEQSPSLLPEGWWLYPEWACQAMSNESLELGVYFPLMKIRGDVCGEDLQMFRESLSGRSETEADVDEAASGDVQLLEEDLDGESGRGKNKQGGMKRDYGMARARWPTPSCWARIMVSDATCSATLRKMEGEFLRRLRVELVRWSDCRENFINELQIFKRDTSLMRKRREPPNNPKYHVRQRSYAMCRQRIIATGSLMVLAFAGCTRDNGGRVPDGVGLIKERWLHNIRAAIDGTRLFPRCVEGISVPMDACNQYIATAARLADACMVEMHELQEKFGVGWNGASNILGFLELFPFLRVNPFAGGSYFVLPSTKQWPAHRKAALMAVYKLWLLLFSNLQIAYGISDAIAKEEFVRTYSLLRQNVVMRGFAPQHGVRLKKVIAVAKAGDGRRAMDITEAESVWFPSPLQTLATGIA